MPVKVGINGFGRIGRQVTKAMLERHPTSSRSSASTICSTPRPTPTSSSTTPTTATFPAPSRRTRDKLVIDGHEISVSAERDPAAVPWKKWGADIVIESTGFFTDATKAQAHSTRRQEGHHLRARPQRGHHHRAGRQRGDVRRHQAHTSSRTPPAPPTASPRWPRCCSTAGASRRAC